MASRLLMLKSLPPQGRPAVLAKKLEGQAEGSYVGPQKRSNAIEKAPCIGMQTLHAAGLDQIQAT